MSKNIIGTKQPGFSVKCKNPDCIGGSIQTTLENDSGYSNYTVIDSGKVAFKCHGCGKYGSTYEYDSPNELKNFGIICLNCSEYDRDKEDWSFHIGDVDEETQKTHIECNRCGQRAL